MDEGTAFRRASDGYVLLGRQVRGSQWTDPTPCAEWDIRALVNHVAGEYLWVPELLAGRTITDVGSRLDGDVLGDDPLEVLVNAALSAQAAAADANALTRTVHLSFGDVPGAEYLKQMAVDSVIHSWDLARSIHADETLDPDLVDFSYEEMRQHAEDWRSGGAFGARRAPADDSTQSLLIALTGR
jgi:uncharacterized protein (TIGR03086 family)